MAPSPAAPRPLKCRLFRRIAVECGQWNRQRLPLRCSMFRIGTGCGRAEARPYHKKPTPERAPRPRSGLRGNYIVKDWCICAHGGMIPAVVRFSPEIPLRASPGSRRVHCMHRSSLPPGYGIRTTDYGLRTTHYGLRDTDYALPQGRQGTGWTSAVKGLWSGGP
jgi:hypothetical protein